MANHEAHREVEEDMPAAVMDGGLRRRRRVSGGKAKIIVKSITGRSFPIYVDLAGNIGDVNAIIKKKMGIPSCQERIVWGEKQLASDRILADCGIKEGSTIYLVTRLRGGGFCSAWQTLKMEFEEKVIIYDSTRSRVALKKPRERWSKYSLNAFLFSVAMFSAYLDHSTSTSLTITDIFFVTAFLLFLIIYAALSIMLPYWGNVLVYISWLLLELVLCILMVSFNPYYGFAILLVLVLVVAVALLHPKFKFIEESPQNQQDGNDDIEESPDLDNLFELSNGIANCGGLITAISGHYLLGSFNPVGLFFFGTIALGLYLMMVTTVRVVAPRHATWLGIVLRVLLGITLIITSIDFIVRLRTEPQHVPHSSHRRTLLGLRR